MISLDEINRKAQRLWPTILRSIVDGEEVFPWEISLGMPRGQDLLSGFDRTVKWLTDIRIFAQKHQLSFRETKINHRHLGEQVVPTHLVVDSLEKYLLWQGKQHIFQTCEAETRATLADFPELSDWLLSQIEILEKHRSDWPAVRVTLQRFVQGDVERHFLRELDIPGVDSKFVERHRTLLSELLTLILPPHRFDSSIHPGNVAKFCQRFGLRYDQPLIRFRWLDESLKLETAGLGDISIPIGDFCQLQTQASTVFIVENKINGLSFPPRQGALVVFGLGYGVDILRDARWLHSKSLIYWGDLDSHGFAILARLRHSFPQTQSLLMDENTLLSGREFWVREASPYTDQIDFSCLTEPEGMIFTALRSDRYGPSIRLEQERIPFANLRQSLFELAL